jgi:hypothetical protein
MDDDAIEQVLCIGVVLPPPPLEDEAECRVARTWVMKHSEHAVEVGEHDDEIFREVPLDLEIVPRYAEVIHHPPPEVDQRNR